MEKLLIIVFLLCCTLLQAQPGDPAAMGNVDTGKKDTIKPPIQDYKIISVSNDTTFVDTSLTIQKDYKFNYLRKDNFELLPFSNTGQTYNSLSYKSEPESVFPDFGAGARHFNFMEVGDIYYYRVPTPLTELYFKTVPEQGQQLDAFFTINTSDRFNFSVAYKGVRALGKYQHQLTSTGNFRFTLNYQSKNNRYQAKAHFVSQDLMNEENGGLSQQAIQQYVDKEPEFEDRSVLEVRYQDAQSTLYGKRFYLDHKYRLTGGETGKGFSVGHIFRFDYKKYDFQQSSAKPQIYGDAFETSNLRDVVRLESLYNEAFVSFDNSVLGKLKLNAGFRTYNYGYNTIYEQEEGRIENRLKGNVFNVGGSYSKQLGGFALDADASLNLGDDFSGNYIRVNAGYSFNEDNKIDFGLKQSSRLPDFNFLLYQSDYISYNWQNDFDNINSQEIYGELKTRRFGSLSAQLSQIQDYAYFGLNEEGMVKPYQYSGQVRYFKAKAEKGFDLGLFGVDNTLMYQNVLDGKDVLNVPQFVTRNSLYYKDHWFQKALYLQTGFTFKYFTQYNMNAYDPVLAEFYVQNAAEYGDYPVVDFFFNAKVDQARIFFKLQHVNSLIQGNNNFTAPGYPYADFLIRFGLVWNFFM
ncbi:putative porin [Salegentibacter chungangensis]|uniref:Porin n=1 Tax=Salegentibacter chungangensis TaxID=1335724 RepID=A0ABW3NLH9_9FLAO